MKNIIALIIVAFSISSCSSSLYEGFDPTNSKAVYDEFWHHVNENYIYFREKNVDWSEVYEMYGSTLDDLSSEEDLFRAMEGSILELRDTHNRLATTVGNAKVHNYKEGYDIHHSIEVIKTNYIDGSLEQSNIFSHGLIDKETVYVSVPKMESIRYLKALLRKITTDEIKNIVIDLRNNSGGNSNDVPMLLNDYVSQKTYLGGYVEKSGPSIDDTTDPIGVYAEPSLDYQYDGKVFVLINRIGYSATSYMAAMCKNLSNFTLVGQITGGGGGGNAGYELSNGWLLSISVSDFVDADGRSIELGVEPDVFIENTKEDIEEGRDRMLEAVLSLR